nr:MAG TPA: hypothetical protein [Caudoviricetes sp.]
MRKTPYRERGEISQAYNDGAVTICEITDAAAPGAMPEPKATPKATLRYAEQRLGINRLYLARQNQVEIERVIRVQRAIPVSTQDLAIDERGQQYRIDTVQATSDVYPPSLDLSLVRVQRTQEVPL